MITTHQSISNTLKTAYLSFLHITIPYISEAWKIYCNETHSNLPSNPSRPSHLPSTQQLPRLSTTTINDHQPRAYFRMNPTTPSPSQTTISHYFPLTQPSQSTHRFSSPQKHPVSHPLAHTEYILPPKHHKNPQPSHLTSNQHSPTTTTSPNQYITLSPLIEEPPYPTQNIQLQFPPHYRFEQPSHLQNCTPTEILSRLQLFSYDVPANGDCFYNAIQLYLHHLHQDPIFISIPQLRSRIANLLTSTSTGSNILKQYYESPLSIPLFTLTGILQHPTTLLQPLLRCSIAPLQYTTTARKHPLPPPHFIHTQSPNPTSSRSLPYPQSPSGVKTLISFC